MNTNQPGRRLSLHRPAVLLGATLLCALAIGSAPSTVTAPLRGAWREALRPSLSALQAGSNWSQTHWNNWRYGNPADNPQAQKQIAELEDERERLEAQLRLSRGQSARGADAQSGSAAAPLLLSGATDARVLGRQAKSFLRARDMLDVGSSAGTAVDALVVDGSRDAIPLVDQGRDAGIQTGRLILAGRSIWGKVAEVGAHTSTVRRATEAGYRDLVQLATADEGRLQLTARGVLVGRGETLCKIELVETTQPVAVGDLVFTADDGVLDTPLLYGKVVRLERKPGAAHWEIWMKPAVDTRWPPERVAVLKVELNPARVAVAGSR